MIQKAQEILKNNWRENFTIPCDKLYPFQWFWDSGFIAIGWAYFDMAKAKQEITTLLNTQWKNGFVPHIAFHNESDTYFPGKDYHLSALSPNSNEKYPSTGMTQPPVTGFVLEEMLRIAEDKADIKDFISREIDRVYANHQYFYKHRDINNEGLVYIYHNWESGTDNSPLWDDIWATFAPPKYTFERRDTGIINAEQRPSKREYDYYLHIINIAKEHHYDDAAIAQHSPFLVQDPLFNTMLMKSNESLIRLYQMLGGNQDKIKQLETWQNQAKKSFNQKLWNDELNAYVHYDLRNNRQIAYVSSSSFAPLYANIPPKERAEKLIATMMDKFGGDDMYLCASFDPTHKFFDPKRYWRGPVWINLNWMLYYGLQNYGYNDIAKRVKKDSIELLEKCGFYEYFDPRKAFHQKENGGYGGFKFSWSAALIIDMINARK